MLISALCLEAQTPSISKSIVETQHNNKYCAGCFTRIPKFQSCIHVDPALAALSGSPKPTLKLGRVHAFPQELRESTKTSASVCFFSLQELLVFTARKAALLRQSHGAHLILSGYLQNHSRESRCVSCTEIFRVSFSSKLFTIKMTSVPDASNLLKGCRSQ